MSSGYGIAVDVHDPWADAEEAQAEYGLDLVAQPVPGTYDGVILAVAHQQFRDGGAGAIRDMGRPGHVLYDLKSVLPHESSDLRL